MKNSIIIIIALSLISLAGLNSCVDFLTADNKSAVTADEQFSKQVNFETLVNQAYFTMRSIYSSPAIFCSGTDMYAGIRTAGDATLEGYSLTSDNGTVKSLYTNLYGLVNTANAVLFYADKCEDYSGKELRKEEARFIRAYAYYVLSQQFGGVPVIKNYINSAETFYPRNTLKETYTFIIDELKELSNSSLLSETDKTGRASKQAAKALLAKVYLAAGWDLETSLSNAETGGYTVNGKSYFENAAKTAKEVCDAIPLTMSFEEKWSPKNEQNDEAIFAIQWDRSTSLNIVDGGQSQQNNFGTYLGAVTLGMKYVQSDLNITSKTFYLFEKGDKRYDATFMTTVYNYKSTWGTEGYWAYYNAAPTDLAKMQIAFYNPAWYVTNEELAAYQTAHAAQLISTGASSPAQIIRTSEPVRWITYKTDGTVSSDAEMDYKSALTKVGTIPSVKKFDDPLTDIGAATGSGSYRDIVILNASEIYLVAAEANLMAGNDASALTYLNNVRKRAGATLLTSFSEYKRFDPEDKEYVSADQSIDVILDERSRELLGEYYRWMDLRRTHQLVKYNLRWNSSISSVSSMTGGDGNIKWYRPIPADEIGLNTGIDSKDQNPGYTADTKE
jgi:starch-binding outer membrane protein, SusD/RagB family